jgi:DNA repair exonuclease SbcCD ATPase subunit
MKITLQKLAVKNFKGIQDMTIEPNGNDVRISGQNASGKTTLAGAFFYCLFGKDSAGSAQFSIKPLDHDGSDIHNLETTVEIVLSIDGKDVALKKRYTEKWVKSRGSAKKEFQGHTTDHFIDGLPLKKKEYDDRVAALFDIDKFNLVTNPAALNAMHWKDRRDILLSMCGNVTTEDVAASDPDLEKLAAMLKDQSIDDHIKRIKAEQKDINKELTEIPVRIQENQNAAQAAPAPSQQAKKSLDYRMTQAREKLQQVRNNERLSALQVQLNEIKSEIIDRKNQSGVGVSEAREMIRKEIDKLGQQHREVKARIDGLQDLIDRDERRNQISREALEAMRKEWHEIRSREYDGSETCPTCGQDLPEDQVADAVAKFNQAKARNLKENEERGRELAQGITRRQNHIDEGKAKIEDQQKLADQIKAQIDTKDKEYADVQPVAVDTSDLDKKAAAIEAEIDAIKSGSNIREKDLVAEIQKIEAELTAWQETDAAHKAAKKAGDRVKELEAQEKKLAAAYEALEADLFLAEKFVTRQAEMIEENVNSRFDLVKWKLFATQINGGIDQTCVATYQGVPYPDLNTGAKVQIGLDIINMLSRHFDLVAPVWLDNRESVTWLPETDAQMITLAVTPGHEKLKIDIIDNKGEKAA